MERFCEQTIESEQCNILVFLLLNCCSCSKTQSAAIFTAFWAILLVQNVSLAKMFLKIFFWRAPEKKNFF